METEIKFIPAAAGYFAIWKADTKNGYGRAPIAAWQIDVAEGRAAWVHAIPEGEHYTGAQAILCPDGSVNAIDSGDFWESVAEWKSATT